MRFRWGWRWKRASRHFGVFNRSVAREDHPAPEPSMLHDAWDPSKLGHPRQHQGVPHVALAKQ